MVHRCVFVLLAACGGRGPTTIRSTQACDPTGHARVVAATTAAELNAALADVRPGDMIRVTGTLSGDFVVANAGTKEAPIALCGDAVLAGDAPTAIALRGGPAQQQSQRAANAVGEQRCAHANT